MSRFSRSQLLFEGSSGMRDPSVTRNRPRVPPMPPKPISEIGLQDLFDREQTLTWYDKRRGRIGNAAGIVPD